MRYIDENDAYQEEGFRQYSSQWRRLISEILQEEPLPYIKAGRSKGDILLPDKYQLSIVARKRVYMDEFDQAQTAGGGFKLGRNQLLLNVRGHISSDTTFSLSYSDKGGWHLPIQVKFGENIKRIRSTALEDVINNVAEEYRRSDFGKEFVYAMLKTSSDYIARLRSDLEE